MDAAIADPRLKVIRRNMNINIEQTFSHSPSCGKLRKKIRRQRRIRIRRKRIRRKGKCIWNKLTALLWREREHDYQYEFENDNEYQQEQEHGYEHETNF